MARRPPGNCGPPSEQALRHLQAAVDSTPDAVIQKDLDGVVRAWNPGAQALYGYAPDEIVGSPIRTIVPPDRLDELAEIMARLRSGERVEAFDTVRQTKAGERIPVSLSVSLIRDEHGATVGACAIARDISRRVEAEQALQRSHSQLEARVEERTAALRDAMTELEQEARTLAEVLRGTSDHIYAYDTDLRFVFASASACQALGLAPDAIVGRTWEDLELPVAEQLERELRSVFESGTPTQGTTPFQLPSGEVGHYRYAFRPVFASHGGVNTVVATVVDMTEEHEAQLRIAELNRELEKKAADLARLNDELQAFTYSVSHDLRRPLRHLDGYVALALRAGTDLEPELLRYLQTIAESAREMDDLLNELLEFSRLGRTKLHTSRVDLAQLARREAELSQEGEDEARRVEVEIGPVPPVEGDPSLLSLVLANLFGNAFKFTRRSDPARVELGAERAEGMVHVWVRDNGVGFDPAYGERMFGVFERLHARSAFEGTGIGLATVRRIVERHGGRTWAEGAPNAGCTVHFTLPAAERSQAHET